MPKLSASVFRHTFAAFAKNESGQDLVEYALIAVFIALGTIAALKSLSNTLSYLENLFPDTL